LQGKTFEQFILNDLERVSESQVHFLPQNHWIPEGVDFLGRYETLQHDFNLLLRSLGYDYIKLRPRNASKHKPYPFYYTKETQGIVAKVYKKDFDLYEYDKEMLNCFLK
jgi:hypothetical protein